MSSKLSALLSSSIQSSNKPKTTTKNFLSCITKNLFKCKTNRYTSNDYEYIGYGGSQTEASNQLETTVPRASSTMIYHESKNAPTNKNFTFNNTKDNKEMSIYVSDEQLHDQFLICQEETTLVSPKETEITRHASLESINCHDRDEITIIRKSTSPISNRLQCLDSMSESCDYLCSTKISEQELTILPQVSSIESNEFERSVEHSDCIDSIILNASRNITEFNSNHACIKDYEAMFVDDVSVAFSDTVQVLRDTNEEWVYVEVAGDCRKGFVPRAVLIGIDDFIAQLKQHKYMTSSMNLSINV